jgi:hypothetical protein
VSQPRKNRLNPRRRRALARRQAPHPPPQETWGIALPPPPTDWNDRPDWPEEEYQLHHCDICHTTYQGTYHIWCTLFPGLNDRTCKDCNTWETVDPVHEFPFLALVPSPIDPLLREVRDFFIRYDYQPLWKRVVFHFLLALLAVVVARQF